MAKEEWGVKRQCLNCGARFYDLNNKPIVCFKCETVFVPEPLLKSRRWQGGAKPVEKEPAPKSEKPATDEVADDTDEEDAEDDGAGATLIADDGDDDDLSDVVATPVKSDTDS